MRDTHTYREHTRTQYYETYRVHALAAGVGIGIGIQNNIVLIKT